jgi:hypothetical protein
VSVWAHTGFFIFFIPIKTLASRRKFMDAKEAKEKASEAIKAGKEKLGEALSQENIEAGKEKLKAGTAEVKKRISLLPFRNMVEKKIPAETRAKFPVLNKLIPLTNFVFVGLVALVVVAAIPKGGGSGGSGGLGGSPTSASDFKFDLTEDGKGIVITEYTGNAVRVVVPSKIEGLPVVEIRRRAFAGTAESYRIRQGISPTPGDKIVSVYIPDSVTKIENAVFFRCEALMEVRLSDNITIIPAEIFTYSGIKKVNLPKNLKEIGGWAFQNCGELTDLVIPSSITAIRFIHINGKEDPNNDAFGGCGKLPIKTRQALKDLGYEGSF